MNQLLIPHGNIQQNIGINQSPNYYLTNQPFPNSQIPYQVQIPQPNNVTSPPKKQCNTCLCYCCICCGVFCGVSILLFILVYLAFANMASGISHLIF